MSHDDRDQAGGHPVRHRDTYDCLCCPVVVPKERSHSRATRERMAETFRELADGVEDTDEQGTPYDNHIYDGERCVRCSVNIYDADLPGLSPCPGGQGGEPFVYSTTTGEPAKSSCPNFDMDLYFG